MEEENQNMDEMIATCLSEGLDAKLSDELRQWINASPVNRKHFKDMQEIWFASIVGRTNRFDKDKAYKRFLQRTNLRKAKTISMRPFLYAAAGVLLLLIISYASYWQGGEQLKSRFADVIIEAPLGSKTKTSLPDGTLVWLNAGSKITYSQGFGVSERNIRLSGEGYFEVTKNEKAPFCVHTDELQVNVLGTIFNFRNYPEGEEATVSLVEGLVLAKNQLKNEKAQLSPGEKVFLDKKTGEMRVVSVNVQNTVAWTDDYLFFDEELLPDIVRELERSYNVKISLADPSLETFRFYGNFVVKDQTIEEILDMLASTNKLRYRIKGKEITLIPRP
ncbi:MAG: DUF4974 domain-containing protein [Tannerella sp.]|jgi:ferric-dicitrate binding protein FerR (iron transport regulator)|nr:DUF4974 domain-containing protein [Tannerella sp.]